MFKKIWQIIIFFIFFSLAAVAQLSLINAWPGFFNQINLVLIVVVFTLFFFGLPAAFAASLISGFWLGLFSFNFFGLYLIALFLTAVLAQRILSGWLTNRSLYSFLFLILLATIGYNFITGVLLYFSAYESETFFLIRGNFWLSVAYQSIWSLIAALLAFSLTNAATRHLKPFFLEKKGLV